MITPKPHIPHVEGSNDNFQGYATVNGCRDAKHYTNILVEGKCDSCGREFGYSEDDGENVKPRTEREWDDLDKGDDEYHARVDNKN